MQGPKRGGLELPIWVHSSGPAKTFDLENDDDLAELYEIVLTNGDEETVLAYVNVAELTRLWPQLRLPAYVRTAWDERLAAAVKR
jgi:hypothetical protein